MDSPLIQVLGHRGWGCSLPPPSPLPSLSRGGGLIVSGLGKEGRVLGPQGSLLPARGEDPGEEEEGLIVIGTWRRGLSRVGSHLILY